MTLDEALNRISELETEVQDLRLKLRKYENKSLGGRRKHDEKWQQGYDLWIKYYEDGCAIAEVMDKMDISRRTYYRYKEYFQQMQSVMK